ncbi:hypothetical protein LPJ61_007049 [Coemansia biformis]|uniref:Uncharacterized protein n=1 Tax=Coemansia biformis TaxID=1286918 RepID=A0A9W7XNY3_9FUNG|nr:hypothetical protein LPJ61_007049 [Coemansia biformis]
MSSTKAVINVFDLGQCQVSDINCESTWNLLRLVRMHGDGCYKLVKDEAQSTSDLAVFYVVDAQPCEGKVMTVEMGEGLAPAFLASLIP